MYISLLNIGHIHIVQETKLDYVTTNVEYSYSITYLIVHALFRTNLSRFTNILENLTEIVCSSFISYV